MDKTLPVNKSHKSNAECWKDYKEKKKFDDVIFREKERIRVNAYILLL